MAKKNILFLIPPAIGHLNPVTAIANELAQQDDDVNIIFMGVERLRSFIEASGSFEYVEYECHERYDHLFEPANIGSYTFIGFYQSLMSISEENLKQVLRVCEERKPIAVVYDALALHGRYLFSYIENHNKKTLAFPVPKEIYISTSFATMDGIFPNRDELKIIYGEDKVKLMAEKQEELNSQQRKINSNCGLSVSFRTLYEMNPGNGLNICCALRELQPRAELLEKEGNYQFVGRCFSETSNSKQQIVKKNEKLDSFLNSVQSSAGDKLVFASLGTQFNMINPNTFEKIIKAVADRPNYKCVLSLGGLLQEYEEKIEQGKLSVPDNVLLVRFAPQTEILQKADLFITHAGMNSTTETIHYGVPVVCLPQAADQPFLAKHLCNELNMGVLLDSVNFLPQQMGEALDKVLKDSGKFLENVRQISETSKKNNGILNSANLISKYIAN
jgi:MGT family glycosyltransferase